MGFKAAREDLISALSRGDIQFPYRAGELESKNHLAVGKVSVAEVISMLLACHGDEYKGASLHAARGVRVHVFKPMYDGRRWYIKAYLIGSAGYFISVHPTGE